jgi:hypothetical protein
MKVTIDYPGNATFFIRTKVKPFKPWPKEDPRTRLLRRWLKRNNFPSPCHAYSDYVVECVERSENGDEHWIVGS